MVTRLTRQDAANQLEISINTLDRRIGRGELATVKEPFGSRERVYVLLEDTPQVPPSDNPHVDTPDNPQVVILQAQVNSLEELADYHRAQLTEADRRQQMLLTTLNTAHQTIESLTRALPAPQTPPATPKRPWAWLSWWKH